MKGILIAVFSLFTVTSVVAQPFDRDRATKNIVDRIASSVDEGALSYALGRAFEMLAFETAREALGGRALPEWLHRDLANDLELMMKARLRRERLFHDMMSAYLDTWSERELRQLDALVQNRDGAEAAARLLAFAVSARHLAVESAENIEADVEQLARDTVRQLVPGRGAPNSQVDRRETPVRVGGDVKAPVVISRVEPDYTEEGRKARVQGIVIVELIIQKDGSVSDVKVLKGLPFGLDAEAVKAVRQWKFKPATLAGQAVPSIFLVTVNMKLP